VLTRIEEDAGAGEEDESRGAEMRDPAGQEDAGCGASGGEPGIDANVIDGHEDHDGAAKDIDRGDARRGSWNRDGGSGLQSGAHGALRRDIGT